MDKIQDARNNIFEAEARLSLAREELDEVLRYESNPEFKKIKDLFEEHDEYEINSIKYDFSDIKVNMKTSRNTNTYGGWNTLPRLYEIGYHPIRFDFDTPYEITITLSSNI